MSMSEKSKRIFETTDPEGRSISLHEDTLTHIKKSHPEISTSHHKIRSTIQNPDVITEITDRRSLAYTSITSLRLYYNVYAKMDDEYRRGFVTTTFVQRDLPKGDIVWTKKASTKN